MPHLDDDGDLVRAYLQGDEGAFTDIYRRHAPLIFAVAVRSLGDRDQAEEVVASTFAHAAQRLGMLREPSKLRSWLLAVARAEVSHLIRSIVRERRRYERLVTVRPIEGDEPDTAESSYARDVLAIARAGLSTDDQALLGLVLSDISGRELADALGIDTGAADTRKSRLYDRLRLAIEVYWVTRPGRRECPELHQLLMHRNETVLSRALCRAVERHCRTCLLCEEERKGVTPLALLGLAPIPMFPAHLLAKSGSSLIIHLGEPSIPISQWRDDGFPPPRSHIALLRHPVAVGVAATVLVLGGTGLAVATTGHRGLNSRNTDIIRRDALKTVRAPISFRALSPSTSVVHASKVPSPAVSDLGAAKLTVVPTAPAPKEAVKTKKEKKKGRPGAPVSTAVTTKSTSTTVVVATTTPSLLVLDTASVDLGSSATSTVIAFHGEGASLTWTASVSVAWLAVTPSSGTIAPGASASLTVEMNRAIAPTGALDAAVTLTTATGTASATVSAMEYPPPSVVATKVPTCLPTQPATFAATVTSSAGIASVNLSLIVPGETSPTDQSMTLSGNSYETTVLGPFPRATGSATWSIIATDRDGKVNAPPASGTIPYGNCG